MNHLRQENNERIENSIIKNVRNIFGLKTEIVDSVVKNIRNLFRENK